MIKIENLEVFNFDGAIRGMRNPMNSWEKSDSGYCNDIECKNCPNFNSVDKCWMYDDNVDFIVGDDDLNLMRKLYKAGPEHAKFSRQIFVSFDVTAPLYWLKEFDTYKVGTTSNSCSTMHTIHKRDLTLEDFSTDKMDKESLTIFKELINHINTMRRRYTMSTQENDVGLAKHYWWQIIQLLPSSYNQRRTISMTYANLVNILKQRQGHKLDEWQYFCEYMLKNAPYLKELYNAKD